MKNDTNYDVIQRCFYGFCSIVMMLTLSACVTTTVSGSSSKVNLKKAAEENVKLGMTYLNKGIRDNALRSFTKAIEQNKRSADAYYGMAMLHQLNGESDLADKNFATAFKYPSATSKTIIRLSYGRFLYEQKRYEEAMEIFDTVSKDMTFPQRENALYYLGKTAQKLDNSVRAKASFDYALNLEPRLAVAAIELADIAFSERDYPNANKYLRVFAANSQHSPRSLWLGIRLERIFGNKDKEASYALALRNLHPYSREYLDYKNLLE